MFVLLEKNGRGPRTLYARNFSRCFTRNNFEFTYVGSSSDCVPRASVCWALPTDRGNGNLQIEKFLISVYFISEDNGELKCNQDERKQLYTRLNARIYTNHLSFECTRDKKSPQSLVVKGGAQHTLCRTSRCDRDILWLRCRLAQLYKMRPGKRVKVSLVKPRATYDSSLTPL